MSVTDPATIDTIQDSLDRNNKRVSALEKHVAQLRADQSEIRKTLNRTATRTDIISAADRINRHIDSSVGTIVEAFASLMRARSRNGS